jgi:hypothetical protein
VPQTSRNHMASSQDRIVNESLNGEHKEVWGVTNAWDRQ